MDASVVDLRYRMADVLKALERNEKVNIYSRGKLKGIIIPPKSGKKKIRIEDHPAFGMWADDPRPVDEVIRSMRKGRYDHLRQ